MAALTRIRNNQVYNSDIDASTKLVPGSITGALWQQNLTYSGNLTVGNLTVNGNTTTLDTTNLLVSDPIIALNRNQTGSPSYDLGFVMGRGNQTNVAFIWQETAKQFQLQYTTESTSGTTFGTINNSGYANLQAYGALLNNATITTVNITNATFPNVRITGGYIDGTAIGANTPNSIVATSVTTSSGGQHIGYLTGAIGANTANTGAFTTLTTTGTLTSQGTITSANQVIGYLNGAIGANSANTGAFTTITATSTLVAQGTITSANQVIGYLNGALGANSPNTVVATSVTTSSGGQHIGYLTGAIGANAANTGAFTTITTTGAISASGTISGPTINAGTIGNSGATFSGASSTLTGASQAASFTTSGGGQHIGYITGAIGANTPNTGVFTSLSATGTFSASTINAGIIGNTGSQFLGANIYLSGNANINNGLALNSNATLLSDQATASVFNTVSTTVNMGGAATTVNLAKADATSKVSINGTANSYGSGQGALQIAGGFYAGGDSYIRGNLIVANITSLGFNQLIVNAPLVYLQADESNYNYSIGFYSQKSDAVVGYNHTGFVRNHTDNLWYLFSNIASEPSNTVDLANVNAILDTIKLGNLIVSNNFNSASSTTGAATIAGGLGVARTLYAGSIQNTPIGNGTASTGAFTTLTTSGVFTASGNLNVTNINGSGAITIPSVIANGGTNTSSLGVGSLIVSGQGGASIGGNLYVGGNIFFPTDGAQIYGNDTDGATDPAFTWIADRTSGIFNPATGVVGITSQGTERFRIDVTGNTVISQATVSTSSTTGALVLTGTAGAGIGGALYTGGIINASGNIVAASGTASSNSATAGALVVNGGAGITGNINAGGVITASGNIWAASGVASSNTNTVGALVVTGGVGISGNINTGGVVRATGNIWAASGTASSNSTTAGALIVTGGVGISGNINTGGVITASGNIWAASGTASASTTTGALVVTGGAGVSGNINSNWTNATTGVSSPTAYHNTINPFSGLDINLNVPATGDIVLNAARIDANTFVYGNSAAGFGNVFAVNGATGQVGVRINPNAMVANAALQVNSTDSIIISAGTTGQRPGNGTSGMIRYNSTTNQVEYWNAGSSSWSSISGAFTTITEDTFTGDGNQVAFTLSQSSSTNGTIVSINGVVQIPITAYSVSGTTLTFTEAPLATDIIDARVIASTATITGLATGTSSVNLVDSGAGTGNASTIVNNTVRYVANTATGGSNYFGGGIAPAMNPVSLTSGANTIVDSFSASTFTGAKYLIKMYNASTGSTQMSEMLLVGNTTTLQYTIVANTYIGGVGAGTVAANVSAGTVYVVAKAAASGYVATAMPIYMPI